jgi:basic amino acid/polyamine antiporter, APA family
LHNDVYQTLPAREGALTLNTSAVLERGFVKALGPVMLTAAVVNVIVGGGIFRLPAQLSESLGAASPLAFLLGALLMLPITLCFAAVGSRVASTGGPYSYLAAAFGVQSGFVAGALMWICNIASSAGIAAALIDLLALAVPEVAAGLPRVGAFFLLYGALMALNLYGVALGGRVLVMLATLKLLPLLLLVLIGIWFVDLSQIHWTAVPSLGALGASMVAVIFAYSGIETALIPSGEVRDPARDVPRAALAATLLVIALYMGIQVICQATLGSALASDKTAIASAAGTLWAPGKMLIIATAGISMTGFLMGNLLGSARVAYALGRDGFLPSAIGAIGQRGVPHWAIVAHASLTFVLACVGNFEFLILVSAGANCLIYLGVACAAWQLQRRDVRLQAAPFLMPAGIWLVPGLSVLAMLLVLSTLGLKEWGSILIALAALVLLYQVLRRMR